MADTTKPLSHDGAESHQLSDIVRSILDDVGRIIRGEMLLARTELREEARRAGGALGLVGGAAITGLLAAACFVTACIAALALVMPVWLAALLMGILLAFIAGGAYAVGRTKLRDVDIVPPQTVQTMRENVEWAKHRTES